MLASLNILLGLLRGLGVTLQLLIYSSLLALLLSFIAGFLNLAKWKILQVVANVYIEVFRGTSLLVQLFWLYFCLPLLGIELPAMVVGVLGLGLNYGAYGAVVVSTSIKDVPRKQTEAAIALNLSPFRRFTSVVLPQAFLIMLPTFSNLSIELLKGTSLVSLITLSDLTFQAVALRSATMQTTTIFSFLLIIYFIIAYPITLGFRWLEKRLSIGRS